MEFVLNTTTSTPTTSRSGSVMHFGDYREDEENTGLPKLVLDEKLAQYFSDSDDEDTKLLDGFNELSARHRLTSSEHCVKITLDRRAQEELALEIGANVSHEHPWKQIRRSDLLCHLPDSAAVASDDIKELQLKLAEADDIDLILVGYAQPLIKTDEPNTFLVYAEPKLLEDSVIDLIRNLELFERVRTEKSIFKRAKPWRSLGSEKEVNLKVDVQRTERIEIEVQRVSAPARHHVTLQLRLAEDVRDGYVELLPKAVDFDCVQRKRVSIGIQSAAQRIHSEQQTDPTFPTNAWAQYCYEMPGVPCTDADIQLLEEDAKSAKSKQNSLLENFEISENIQSLIKVLEFNTIDIYRDDYSLITSDLMSFNYVGDLITEAACYLDFEKLLNKYVVALAWHPTIFGLFAIAYSHDCLNIFAQDRKIPEDELYTKSVLRTNHTLLWSFSDSLHPKLVLNSPREIVTLSFCPRDGNLLVGGMTNGQFVIWDLQSHLMELNAPKLLKGQDKLKRDRLHSLMAWSKCFQNSKLNIVHPMAITSVEQSHKKPVSVLYWVKEEQCGDGKGLIQQHIKHGPHFKLLLTASIDGSISLWDVDGIDSNGLMASHAMKQQQQKNGQRRRSSSSNKPCSVLRPIHTVACDQPITSLIFGGVKLNEIADRERFLVTSCMGTIGDYSWDDFRELKSDTVKLMDTFGAIHNGSVLRCASNPFHGDAFLSVGWHIFAIWSGNSTSEPVFWRRREAIITCAAWSTKRATMFFVAMHDGVVEVWDIAVRRDIPVISYDSGLTLITVITQNADDHRVLIADGRANTRTLMLHNRVESTDGAQEFQRFMAFGTDRIRRFEEWRAQHTDTTTDYLEAKETRREDSRKFLDATSSEDNLHAKKKPKRNKGSRLMRESATEYSDDLRRRYEKRSVKRLIGTLLELKQLNLETIEMHIKPEKDRQLYNSEKRRAVEKSFRQMHEEISEVRAKLTVPEAIDEHTARMDFIANNAASLCELDGVRYEAIATELDEKIQAMHADVISLNWHEFLEKAKKRRLEMNRAIYEKKRRIALSERAKGDTTKTLIFDCTELKKNRAQ